MDAAHAEATRLGMARRKAAGAQFGKPVSSAFMATYARVLSLLEDGHGFNAVARMLNADGTPTARGRTWYASTVKAIAESETAKHL